MPDAPDLSRVDDRALDAFLSATLRPDARRWYVSETQHGSRWGIDNILRTFPEAVAEAARVPGREPFQCIATPRYASTADGAAAVIEAMAAQRDAWHFRYHRSPRVQRSGHLAEFYKVAKLARGLGQASSDTFPRAVAEAAARALWPTASAEARALVGGDGARKTA